MAANNRDVDSIDWISGDLVHELVCSDAIKCCDTADLLGIETFLLVQLAHGWNDRVHRVHDES